MRMRVAKGLPKVLNHPSQEPGLDDIPCKPDPKKLESMFYRHRSQIFPMELAEDSQLDGGLQDSQVYEYFQDSLYVEFEEPNGEQLDKAEPGSGPRDGVPPCEPQPQVTVAHPTPGDGDGRTLDAVPPCEPQPKVTVAHPTPGHGDGRTLDASPLCEPQPDITVADPTSSGDVHILDACEPQPEVTVADPTSSDAVPPSQPQPEVAVADPTPGAGDGRLSKKRMFLKDMSPESQEKEKQRRVEQKRVNSSKWHAKWESKGVLKNQEPVADAADQAEAENAQPAEELQDGDGFTPDPEILQEETKHDMRSVRAKYMKQWMAWKENRSPDINPEVLRAEAAASWMQCDLRAQLLAGRANTQY